MSAAASSTVNRTKDPTANTGESAGEIQRRINFLLAENAEYERRAALYRTAQEKTESLSMYRPQTTAEAYRMLGMLLGAFAPAAYFARFDGFGLGPWTNHGNPVLFFLLLFMNAVCIVVGLNMGKVVGRKMEKLSRSSWSKMLLFSLLMALFWAAVTGYAGGAIVFVVGGFFGVGFALPVALAAFPAFAVIHRLMERGHLVEKKHLLPIAYGISLTISAFILGF
ncbi:MAG TPA: hypothetical protein VGO50_08345 [Pyrinomonadaceae bacterium]|jgi:hypothetical protein|nr:hypothetical protein [Pyrinomonadaceae bacterium]